jgi:DNA-binding transcriptional LysR family regulator
MRDVHLRNVDLNLIHPLRALLEECHVTRAAKRSFLSQSAMSRALERLREVFGAPLLVRNGRGYERPARGERVLRDLESLMPRIEHMVRGEKFDPVRSHEVFRIAMSDHASIILLPSLLASVRRAATHIRLEVSASQAETYEDVAAGRIDTFLCAEEAPPSLESEAPAKQVENRGRGLLCSRRLDGHLHLRDQLLRSRTIISWRPIPAGQGPTDIGFTFDSRYAYVTNGKDGTLSLYSDNPSTGYLTAMTPSSFPQGGGTLLDRDRSR